MDPNQVLHYFDGRRDEMIEAIRQIVDIESPSHDHERSLEVVDWVVEQVNSLGLDLQIERIPADGYGEHLIIRAFPGAQKSVFLLGHTDTVHPVGTALKNPTRIEGDLFYGCGIFDMKANIVLMIEALRFISANGLSPERPITILLSCDEEVGSHMGRGLVEREAANAEKCLVFEPSSSGRLKTGRKGTAMYTLIAHGKPAHAGLEPEKGVNAISEIARQVANIHGLADAALGTTVNVCTIKGGTTSNVIPDLAKCDVDVRFSKMSEAERVDAAMHSMTAFDTSVRLELRGGINRPPLERNDEVVSFYQEARGMAAGFGYELGETQVGGASDGNFVAAMGVPILDGLGVTGDGAHMLSEHILVSDIPKRAALVTLILLRHA